MVEKHSLDYLREEMQNITNQIIELVHDRMEVAKKIGNIKQQLKIEIEDEKGLLETGKRLLDHGNFKALLITRGSDGMTLFEEDGGIIHIKSVARKVYDVTGAGDTVIAILTLGMTAGLDLRSSAYLSNVAAGIVVGEIGTSAVKTDDLKRVISAHFSQGR